MVRTSAPVVGGTARLADSHGKDLFQNIETRIDAETRTGFHDAKPGPVGPDIPELGTTLQTHDLNGELVKKNLSGIEGGNDNVEALFQANVDMGNIKP